MHCQFYYLDKYIGVAVYIIIIFLTDLTICQAEPSSGQAYYLGL